MMEILVLQGVSEWLFGEPTLRIGKVNKSVGDLFSF
jgi:hypothetical protein